MSMDTGGINLVNIGDFSPAKGRVFEVGPKHDSVLGNLEVAVDQVNPKNLVGIVTDEHFRQVCNMLFRNGGLVGVIKKRVVSVGVSCWVLYK